MSLALSEALSEGQHAPTVLMPYQQEWCGDDSQVKVIEKSRRIGISWAEAADSVIEASSTNGCDVWYVGYNKDMAQEFIRDCATWARTLGEKHDDMQLSMFEDDDPDKQILMFTIRFASGWKISALSSRPTNLRNKRGRIIIDEAAFHPDLKGLLKSALAILIWGGKSSIRIISTHNGVENDFYAHLVEGTRAGKLPYTLHRVTFDDALDQGLYKRICLVNGKEWTEEGEEAWRQQVFAFYGTDADEELLCIPSRSGGTYLPRKLVEEQMREGEVFRLELEDDFVRLDKGIRWSRIQSWCMANLSIPLQRWPKEFLSFFGEDFGRTSDRTVIVPGYLTQTLVRRFPWAVELFNVPFEHQYQILCFIVDSLIKGRFIGGALDATGNGAYLAEQAALRYGEELIQQVKITDKWYSENLPPLKAAFEDKTIELVRDADHLSDLAAFKIIKGIPKLPNIKNAATNKSLPPRHGDAAIAYALGHAASRLPIENYSYEATDPKTVDDRREKPARYVRVKSQGGIL